MIYVGAKMCTDLPPILGRSEYLYVDLHVNRSSGGDRELSYAWLSLAGQTFFSAALMYCITSTRKYIQCCGKGSRRVWPARLMHGYGSSIDIVSVVQGKQFRLQEIL